MWADVDGCNICESLVWPTWAIHLFTLAQPTAHPALGTLLAISSYRQYIWTQSSQLAMGWQSNKIGTYKLQERKKVT